LPRNRCQFKDRLTISACGFAGEIYLAMLWAETTGYLTPSLKCVQNPIGCLPIGQVELAAYLQSSHAATSGN
jgi:hypothetical protein